jgi:hypothetical protein
MSQGVPAKGNTVENSKNPYPKRKGKMAQQSGLQWIKAAPRQCDKVLQDKAQNPYLVS